MDDLIEFVFLTLIVWRITSLLVREDGPGEALAKLRRFIGVYYDEFSNLKGKNWVAQGITCFWCASVWVSAVVGLFASYSVNIRIYVGVVLALSAAAIIVEKIIGED